MAGINGFVNCEAWHHHQVATWHQWQASRFGCVFMKSSFSLDYPFPLIGNFFFFKLIICYCTVKGPGKLGQCRFYGCGGHLTFEGQRKDLHVLAFEVTLIQFCQKQCHLTFQPLLRTHYWAFSKAARA